MVDGKQYHGFNKLSLHHRAADGYDRFVRENRRSLRHRPDIAGKTEMPQIIQKFLAEQGLGAEIFDILLGEGEVFQILDHLSDAGHDRQSAAVRNPAEEHVKIRGLIGSSVLKKAVGHGQFIKIGQKGEVFLPETGRVHRGVHKRNRSFPEKSDVSG